MTTRQATHAGSWYTKNGNTLDEELTTWLEAVQPAEEDGLTFPIEGCKAIIAPHAGYSYSGPAAAWAYRSIDTTGIKRVFILGPAHHVYMDGCAISICKEYATPIGSLPVDESTIAELRSTGSFEEIDIEAEEEEHSIEMHLPYIRKVFEGIDISIVPIVVGAIDKVKEIFFGGLLAPFLARSDTLCVVSSDFCHWGTRFSYTYYYPEPPTSETRAIRLSRSNASPDTLSSHPIHASISALDHEAMDLLTLPPSTGSRAHDEFVQYLIRTKNTICGRHPIGVMLGAMSELEKQGCNASMKWVRYEQSSQCFNIGDSSVSYASAYIVF